MAGETLVVGIGSAQGADRFGHLVIEALRSKGVPPGTRLEICSAPSLLVPQLLQSSQVIVIDAMLGPGPQGTLRVLQNESFVELSWRSNAHGLGLSEAVRLACSLGFSPDRLNILALDVVQSDALLQSHWIDHAVECVLAMLAESH
jgi:hydrogenase maturation protease